MGTSAYHPSDGKRLYLRTARVPGAPVHAKSAQHKKTHLPAANGVFIYYKYKKRTKKRLD